MAERTARAGRRRKGAAPIGFIFILLAVLGLLAVLAVTVQMTVTFVKNNDKTTEFEEFIRPVLMFDPVPYEDPNDLEPTMLLQSSMWAALLGEKRGSYQYDEMKLLVVPSSDLDVNAASLFGPNVTLQHQTFGNYETTFVYDEDTKTYRVPVAAQTGAYIPRVDKIAQDGDTIQLLVGYMPPETLWTADQAQNEDGEAEPDKYMIYVLTETKSGYYISAIRDLPGAGVVPGIEYSIPEGAGTNMPGGDTVDQEALSKLQEEAQNIANSGEETGEGDGEEQPGEDGSGAAEAE